MRSVLRLFVSICLLNNLIVSTVTANDEAPASPSRSATSAAIEAFGAIPIEDSKALPTVSAKSIAVPTDGAGGASGGSEEPVCVIASQARLRSAPSTKARITWKVARHMPLQRISNVKGWSRVRDLRGQIHWVISRSIAANKSCAVVKVRTASLQKGPGPGASTADFKVADRYTPFKKTDREGAWVRLEDEYRGAYWTRETNVWIPVRRSKMHF